MIRLPCCLIAAALLSAAEPAIALGDVALRPLLEAAEGWTVRVSPPRWRCSHATAADAGLTALPQEGGGWRSDLLLDNDSGAAPPPQPFGIVAILPAAGATGAGENRVVGTLPAASGSWRRRELKP
jgi:hypothetical protein